MAYCKLDLCRPRSRRTRRELPKRHLRLTATQLTRLAVSYETGSSTYELAKDFQVDRRTLSQKLKAQGVTLRGQSPSWLLIDEMVQLYQSGLSLVKIGDQVGVDASTVWRYLRSRGTPLRDPNGRYNDSPA